MTSIEDISNRLTVEPLDLPASTTDWQSKVRQLNNKLKTSE
jgi:hypothetical protein